MKPTIATLAFLLPLLGCVASKQDAHGHDPEQAGRAFEMLKSLAGNWQGTSMAGGSQQPVNVSYEVVSGGSVVMERLFAGTPHEMISMYHRDGDRLLLTHYCSQGNQPRMELDSFESSPHAMASFSFQDATNWKGPEELVMHNVRIYPLSQDHLGADWVAWVGGKADHSASFDFKRVP